MEKVKVAVIGAGNRGTYAYAPYIYENSDICEIVAVAEPKKEDENYLHKNIT